MSTRLFIGKDLNGTVTDRINASDTSYAFTTSAGVATSITVPPNTDTVYFSYGAAGNVWVSLNGTATLPTSTPTLSSSELNPVCRYVTYGMTISIICSVINEVQVAFYNSSIGQL